MEKYIIYSNKRWCCYRCQSRK